MPNEEDLSEEDLYQQILFSLQGMPFNDVLLSIEKAVGKGIVSDDIQGNVGDGKSSEIMSPKQRLEIAVSLLLDFVEIPLMVAAVKETFETDEVLWKHDDVTLNDKQIFVPRMNREEGLKLRKAVEDVIRKAVGFGLEIRRKS